MKTDGYHCPGKLVGHGVGIDHTFGSHHMLMQHSEVNQRLVFPGGRPISAKIGQLLASQPFQVRAYAF